MGSNWLSTFSGVRQQDNAQGVEQRVLPQFRQRRNEITRHSFTVSSTPITRKLCNRLEQRVFVAHTLFQRYLQLWLRQHSRQQAQPNARIRNLHVLRAKGALEPFRAVLSARQLSP